MRELEEDVAIKPFNSSHKVYIIENGAQLTEAAQNTFLKTFEEPPEYAVFIIVIENSELLLQTIRSRFTLVHFPSVSDEIVERYITTKYPQEQERLPFLVKYCAGIPGAADDVINDEAFDTLRTDALEKLFSLLSSDKRGAFIIQKFLEENKDRAGDIFNFWLSFMRDITLIHTQSSERIINIDKKEQLRQLAAKIDPKNIVDMSGKIVKASEMLSRYVNIKAISLWLALKHA
jgi:DNA polymerase-3 subunit delta'